MRKPQEMNPKPQHQTQGGKYIDISMMHNAHLMNTIRYLQRNAEDIMDRMIVGVEIEMFGEDEEVLYSIQDEDPIAFLLNHHESYSELLEEAYRRGLLSKAYFAHTLRGWLLRKDAVWNGATRLAFVAKGIDPQWGADYWQDRQGTWSVEVLPDGTAVTVCYDD